MSYYLLDHPNPNARVRSNGKRGWYYVTRTQPIRGIVVHTPQALQIDGPDDLTAEAVAKFFARVDRPASAHVNIDSDSTVELLPDDHTAFHAAGVNSATLGAEVGWRHDMWLDDPALTTLVLERFAVWAAPRCIAYDIPVVRVKTKTGWNTGAKGFLTHAATETWRGYPGRRRDPGQTFPWEQFFDLLNAEIDRLNGEQMITTGDTGNAVSKIQKALNGWRPSLSLDVDGQFGPITKSAVSAYQRSADIAASGAVDGITMALLMEYVPDWIDNHTPPAPPSGIQPGTKVKIIGRDVTITGTIKGA